MKIDFDGIEIPKGEFLMGTNLEKDIVAKESDWAKKTELPQHRVYLDKFYISRTLITNEQWRIFLENSNYNWIDRDKIWFNGFPNHKKNHPIVWVTWFDALAFCNWAGVELPTEAHWEKANRGFDERIYPWGDEIIDHSFANYDTPNGDTNDVNFYQKGRSYFGLLDMAGNTWEWTSTLWGLDKDNPEFTYPYNLDDGRENINELNKLRVVRSAGWKYSSDLVRCSARDWNRLNVRGSGLSFRVIKGK
jgi:formylglycine-generating enzyme required for sulfatase activity